MLKLSGMIFLLKINIFRTRQYILLKITDVFIGEDKLMIDSHH